VTRRIKLGGGALALAMVCLAGWVLFGFGKAEWVLRLVPRLRLGFRRYAAASAAPSPRMAKLPNVYLWAWERPEDLRFLGDQKVGVAFLAKTISVKEPSAEEIAQGRDGIFVRPRLQPLRITPGTPLMAVVRIEALQGAVHSNNGSAGSSASISATQTLLIANEIASAANIPGVSAVQIDFDATLSEHDFYRALLVEVRKRLPNGIPLSITALASWCIGDRWLEQLPPGTIDEAVPMLFRMGTGEREIVNYISSGDEFRVAACGTSVGVSTDEAFSRSILAERIAVNGENRKSQRIYIFSPQAWDQVHAETALGEIQKWHAN